MLILSKEQVCPLDARATFFVTSVVGDLSILNFGTAFVEGGEA